MLPNQNAPNMKYFIHLTLIVALTTSCSNEILDNKLELETILTSNHIKRNTNYTMIVKREGSKVVINRTERKMTDSDLDNSPVNRFYIQTSNLSVDKNGFISAKDPDKKVWFVSYGLGSEPLQVGGPSAATLKCFRYWCNCSGDVQIEQDPICSIVNASTHLDCDTDEGEYCNDNPNRRCTGFATIENCNQSVYDPGNENIEPMKINGGLFIEGDEVVITDPDWYKKRETSVLFVVDEKGRMYKKDEYDAWQEVLKKQEKKD